jgi:23S rRNA (uracil1939-C5)-methyltransferase
VLLTLEVEKATAGGRMLARHEGQVVLVWGAIPGERVLARVERVAKGVVYADTTEVLLPSPDRRPLRGDWRCGGNVLLHVGYARQLRLKSDIVRDAFRRIARVALTSDLEVVPSPEDGYRMRARLRAHGGRLGFLREGTHEWCDAGGTGQLLPSTRAWIASVEAVLRRERLTGLVSVDLAENIPGDVRACHLELHAGVDPARFTPVAEGLSGLSASWSNGPSIAQITGTPIVTDLVYGRAGDPASAVRLQRHVRAFFQGNRYLVGPLVQLVASLVTSGPVADLYAGVGLFGLSLAACGCASVTLVEDDPVSGDDLRANAAPFAARTRVERRSVEAFLASRAERNASWGEEQTFIVDPPRTGLSKRAVAGLIGIRPARVVYVSCDVATLARDARVLMDAGYEIDALRGVDLFPNTAHVETVVRFTCR